MAIVKILKSSKNFSAVLYNESRVEKGEAQLIGTFNFPIPKYNKSGFISYLEKWSGRNSRIKNSQFHVVISLKGKVENSDALLSIAHEWLYKMGYGENPALVYLHNNTNNSHIHIVTSRIGPDGKKIDHNFERVRSQKILNEINGVDKLKELRIFVSNLLKYSFTTRTQFVELCKDSGLKVTIEDNYLNIEKDGKIISLNNSLIDFCSKRYYKKMDEKNKKSIQAKIFKYAKLLDMDSFNAYMRKNFGLKFIYYGKDKKIYGFSIIDYKNQSVYKGSDVFSLKRLNELLNTGDKVIQDKFNLYTRDFIKEHKIAGVNEVNEFLIKNGVFTDGVGFYSLSDNELLGQLDSKLSNNILYNTRVNKILADYKPQTTEEKKVLSKIYHISLKDLERNFSSDNNYDEILYYKGMIKDLMESGMDIKSSLELYGIEIHFMDNAFVLRDSANKIVVSNDRLGVDYDQFKISMHSFNDKFDFGQKYEDEYIGVDYDYEPEVLFVDIISDLFTIRAGVSGGSGRKKKKI